MNRRERRAVAAVYRLCCAAVTLLAVGLCAAGALRQNAAKAPIEAPQQECCGGFGELCDLSEADVAAALSVAAEAERVSEEEAPESAAAVSRYAEVTSEERELMAKIVWLEARGESPEGQQAVAEVILNRVAADNFPSSVEEVIFEGQDGHGAVQFTTAAYLESATPGEAQYEAVGQALYGTAVLPMDVVYFSTSGENDRVWGRIGGHIFCYQYEW